MQGLSRDDSVTALRGRISATGKAGLRRCCLRRAALPCAIFGILGLATVPGALPNDKTKLPWPQLSTSHGPIKSGGEISEEIKGSIDILLTDMPLTDDELKQARELRGVNLLHVATAVTGIVPCYNLDGIKEPINFSPAVLAAIFLGKITKWSDPAIVALNPSSHLPASEIVLVGHGQEDGSTYAWTDYLSKTSAAWRRSVGKVRSLLDLPILLRASTQEETADLVKRTPNSLSYVELWAAKGNGTPFGRIRNHVGRYIAASSESTAAAAQTASRAIGNDFRASITDTTGSDDYPIASFTWVVIPDKFEDDEKRAVVLSFLRFLLTDGQSSPEAMNLGRLPRTIADREIQMLSSVK